MKLLQTLKSTAVVCVLAIIPTFGMAQGVPTIDTRNLLQQLQIVEQLITDAVLQNEQITQLIEQVRLLDEQLKKLEEIEELLSNPTDVLGLAMGIDLDGLLNGEFDVEMMSTILRGARGDWSGLTGDGAERFEGLIGRALTGAGTSQENITAQANSELPAAQRNATATASGAATSAAAEVAYAEAGQSVERVTRLVTEIGSLDTLKESVDHNTRVTAELAIAMAAMWQLESVQTMNVGLSGVLDAATLAEIEKFTTFDQPEFD